jgi:hypothetical protein
VQPAAQVGVDLARGFPQSFARVLDHGPNGTGTW